MSKTKVLKTKKDFYKFFDAIPIKKWTRYMLVSHGRCCALGHLGARDSDGKEDAVSGEDFFRSNNPLAKNLKKIGGSVDKLIAANDDGFYCDLKKNEIVHSNGYLRRSIKESVLAYINSL